MRAKGMTMSYILVSDQCDDCRYVSTAFTLLQMPLESLALHTLCEAPSKITQATSIIACKNVELKHKKQLHALISDHNGFLISFSGQKNSSFTSNPLTHFLNMPFTHYELKEAISHGMLHKKNLPDIWDFNYPIFEKLAGQSKAVCEIKSLIKQVSYSDTTVLIIGESGTGKDVIASCIHFLSNRRHNPLVPINCGAIPNELMESELFGHEKGAFTGAMIRRPGRFEIANSGTLFLDEIGDMPLSMQVKLLRVIQDKKIERVGGNTSIEVDVRLIAATNKNLEDLIQHHQFREDLYYRLNVFPITVPSLHERREDIPLLIDQHLDRIYDRLKHRVVFTERAMAILCDYTWPGNIRELQNFLERMVILHPDSSIDEKDIDLRYHHKRSTSLSNSFPQESFNIKEYLIQVEQQLITSALSKSQGMINSAADYLSMGRTTLIEKIKKYNLLNLTELD